VWCGVACAVSTLAATRGSCVAQYLSDDLSNRSPSVSSVLEHMAISSGEPHMEEFLHDLESNLIDFPKSFIKDELGDLDAGFSVDVSGRPRSGTLAGSGGPPPSVIPINSGSSVAVPSAEQELQSQK
jgi:hypothetical protein